MASQTWDANSLNQIAKLIGAAQGLGVAIQEALAEAGDLLVSTSQENMAWQNPTGVLEASMTWLSQDPYAIEVGSDLPYARRRHWGFSGMTDALGRFYSSDPGVAFLNDALIARTDDILQILKDSIDAAL